MNNDGVSVAFELISHELSRVADDIALQGTLAFKDRRYDDVQKLSDTGKSLNMFIKKANALLEEWQAGIDVNIRRKTHIENMPPSDYVLQSKAPKTRIRVNFANGNKIEENYAADTFALALKEIGFNRVEALKISERGLPLVGTEKNEKYTQRYLDGKYICVHSSTNEKKDTLELIAKKLGVSIEVEVI